MSDTIFYANENQDDAVLFATAVESTGDQLQTFENGSSLMSAVGQTPPNPKVIFVDFDQPHQGYLLVKRLRNSLFRKVPIVIVSKRMNVSVIKKFKELGANLYIRKCISKIKLKSALQYALKINWKTFKTNPKNFFYNAFLLKEQLR